MNKASKILEIERKYLITNVAKTGLWEREQIVYQWFFESDEKSSVKEKLIFDLTRAKIIYVKVTKESKSLGESNKTVQYLKLEDLNIDYYIGKKFVLKRRSIEGKLFLDKFICSNGITDFLLEYENVDESCEELAEFAPLIEVTKDIKYYNKNMCTIFSEKEAEHLKFLLSCFQI